MLILKPNNGILLRDVEKLLDILSKCINKKLDMSVDLVSLSTPSDWATRSSAKHMIRCQINNNRYVILKRCADNPDFVRREEIIAEAKCKLKWIPSYSVIKINGLKLRSSSSGINEDILKGWEDKTILVIDIGNYELAKNLNDLGIKDIEDLDWFCFNYGQWASFNYLFCIRDRNCGNFIFFTDTQTLHSIDNEDGPYDSNRNNAGVLDIVTSTQHCILKFLKDDKKSYINVLKKGFVHGWNTIKGNYSSLKMLSPLEKTFMKKLLKDSPEDIANAIFN